MKGPLLAAGVALVCAFVACAPEVAAPTATPAVPPQVAVVAITEGGQLPTRVLVPTSTPTATTSVLVLIQTVAAIPTLTPRPSPTPSATVIPPYTSTPRPTPTRITGGTFPTTPTASRTPRPTRTAPPRGVVTPPEGAGTSTPTDTPDDPNEPNDVPEESVPLGPEPVLAYINGPGDVDMYAVEVDEPNEQITATLSHPQPRSFTVDIIAPSRGRVGRQRFDGTVSLRSFADTADDLGTYLVQVKSVGTALPQGPYFISVATQLPTPTPTEVG